MKKTYLLILALLIPVSCLYCQYGSRFKLYKVDVDASYDSGMNSREAGTGLKDVIL